MTSDRSITIAIDGHSSCGKSTLARDLAARLAYLYVDSGAMYRAVSYYFIREEVSYDDPCAVESALDRIDLTMRVVDNESRVYLDNHRLDAEIRSPAVSAIVSEVSTLPEVRRKLVEIQRALGAHGGIVMDGRDIGTVVFPDADLKLFVTADIEIRTMRRYRELLERGTPLALDEVKANLEHRDHIDSHRSDSPLREAADAIRIDTSHLTRQAQLSAAYQQVRQIISR